MNQTTKKYLQIGGIVAGAGTILALAGVRLYKMYQAKKQQAADAEQNGEETPRHFAPSYLGKHKPHHRKAKANGLAHSVAASN